MKNITEVYVGVDVSKSNLDIYIHPLEKLFKIPNTKSGIKAFTKELSKYNVAKVACEATGGYESLFANILRKKSYNIWIIDPRRVRGFIIATGCKCKTDKIDAQKIAEFAYKNSQGYTPILKNEIHEQLQALINRKKDLTIFLAAEKTRLKHPSHALSLVSIKKLIKTLGNEIKTIDGQIEGLVKNDKELHEKTIILESIPGIGKSSAALLLSFVPELGYLSNAKISALIGVCPYANESGKHKGKRYIRGGRAIPRRMLYMCALAAIKFNVPLKEFYDRLRTANKPFKVAITAIMHKLIIIVNSLLKKGELCKA